VVITSSIMYYSEDVIVVSMYSEHLLGSVSGVLCGLSIMANF
jgi:hypothetical protein